MMYISAYATPPMQTRPGCLYNHSSSRILRARLGLGLLDGGTTLPESVLESLLHRTQVGHPAGTAGGCELEQGVSET